MKQDQNLQSLKNKLHGLDWESLHISEYFKGYLKTKIDSLDGVFKIYERLLRISVQRNNKKVKDLCVVDYGGGTGLLSLYFMANGASVIYNDIYDQSCEDFKKLAEALGYSAPHIVCGEMEDIIQYAENQNIEFDTLISFQVIEHIYNLEKHFEALRSINISDLLVIHGTDANANNPFKCKQLKQIHERLEHTSPASSANQKNRDTKKAYKTIRCEFIKSLLPDAKDTIIEDLATQTRGLMLPDIKISIEEYQKSKTISYSPNHPTNTCDPLTGNWAERIISHSHLEQLAQEADFNIEISHGYYTMTGSVLTKIIKKTLNVVISLLGKRAIFISPYILIKLSSK